MVFCPAQPDPTDERIPCVRIDAVAAIVLHAALRRCPALRQRSQISAVMSSWRVLAVLLSPRHTAGQEWAMLAKVRSCALVGLEGELVEVEVDSH